MDVYGLFVGREYRTCVWASVPVQEELRSPDLARFASKLEHIARHGFENAPAAVRLKSQAVYGIQFRFSLFRIYGFFETNDQSTFIAVTCTRKSGQRMNARDRARLEEACTIRETQSWHKNFRLSN